MIGYATSDVAQERTTTLIDPLEIIEHEQYRQVFAHDCQQGKHSLPESELPLLQRTKGHASSPVPARLPVLGGELSRVGSAEDAGSPPPLYHEPGGGSGARPQS